MSRRVAVAALVLGSVVLLAACAPSATEAASGDGSPAGFLLGLWHGFILLFTFVISLFNDSVGVYEANNTGGWYDFGFLLGVMVFFGGSGGSGAGRRRRAA